MSDSNHPHGLFSPARQADPAAIAALLTEAARDLLSLSKPPEAKDEPQKETAPKEKIRCYRFPELAIRCEREIFEEQGVETLQEVLYNASSSLKAFTALLEKIDPEAKLEGVVAHILARELRRVEDLLFRLEDAYSSVEPVEA